MGKEVLDLLVVHAEELVTAPAPGPLRGAEMDRLQVIADGAFGVRGGKVAAVGTSEELESRYEARESISARGQVVLPGFVDAHTHPVFVGTREREFDQRLRGVSYEEITRQGGGIFRSVRDLRAASNEEIERQVEAHLDGFLACGTTTVEAKSGAKVATATGA